jgi:hypothetical protein
MKLGQLVDNPKFLKALRELAAQAIPAIAAYKVATIMEIRDRELKKWQDVRAALLQTYAKKTEAGELATSEDGSQYILVDSDSFNREYNNLIAMDVEGLPKLALEEIKDAKLSAEAILALSPIMTALLSK